MTKTNKNGTTAYHIKETLNNLGFKSTGIRRTLDDMNSDNMILPCIASVIIDKSYKHFIVIYEINYKKKYLGIGDRVTDSTIDIDTGNNDEIKKDDISMKQIKEKPVEIVTKLDS